MNSSASAFGVATGLRGIALVTAAFLAGIAACAYVMHADPLVSAVALAAAAVVILGRQYLGTAAERRHDELARFISDLADGGFDASGEQSLSERSTSHPR